MIRIFVSILAVVFVCGCSDGARELKFIVMPDGLTDCRFYYITNSDWEAMTIARCPISTTTTQVRNGKTLRTTVTIDGPEYVPAAK